MEKGYEYYQDDDEEDYAGVDDEGYYLVGDIEEDVGEEYEYFDDNDNYGEGVVKGDGYYYSDEMYDEGEEGDEEGYFHLHDIDEDGDKSTAPSKRFKLPRATLSISGIPTAIPKAMSQLSTLPSTLKDMNWEGIMTGGGGPAAAAAVLSIVMVALVTRTFVFGGSHNNLTGRGDKKKTKRNWRGKLILPTGMGGDEDQEEANISGDVDEDGVDTTEKYGDYSNAFVDAVRKMEDDDDTIDLDSAQYDNTGSVSKRRRIAKSLRRASSSMTVLASNAWVWIRGHTGVLGRGGEKRPSSDELTESTVADVDAALMRDEEDETNDLSADESNDELEEEIPSSPSSSTDVKRLKRQLDEMSESRKSLEKEYEASLRMLHEARMEVQKMKKVAKTAMDTSAREEEQRDKMDVMVKKLDMKYKSQMKDQIEQLRIKMEGKLRSEVQLEMQERMESQLQERLEEQEEQVEEKVQQRLGEERAQYQEELNRKFKQEVDDAVSAEMESAVDIAVEEAIQRERQKAREEMMRVRQGIQKVLERERKLMREQVRRATGQVREWVVKKQQDQLLQQAGQLQEEAQKLQGLARSRAGGRGGMGTATGVSTGSSRRGRPSPRDEYNDRYEDTDGESDL